MRRGWMRHSMILALAAGSFAVTVPSTLHELIVTASRCRAFASLSVTDGRRVAYGVAFVESVEAALVALGDDRSYGIIPGPTGSQGADIVRLLALPRVPRLLGRVPADNAPRLTLVLGGDTERLAVVPTKSLLARSGDSQASGRQDDSIPCAVDLPRPGDIASRESLVVQGWCQEVGGQPCRTVSLAIDGVPSRAHCSRYARPDVEAAVKGIGTCAQAGFRFDLARESIELGEHVVEVRFETQDRRHRSIEVSFRLGR